MYALPGGKHPKKRRREDIKMKYENSKEKGISKKTLRALEQIALETSCSLELRGGIEVRNNDSEDFPEISIFSIQAMLERAYLLGKADGMKEAQ
jgi:hypothetical protein